MILKKFFVKLVSVCLIVIITLCTCFSQAFAETATSNKFNVVFVLDTSGSMLDTDPDELRYDATKMFLGLLANDGNYVGSVMFSTDVNKKTGVSEIGGKSDKDNVESDIESVEPEGWTAIGTALNEAVNMLDSNGNKDLPSVVILLSDGNSELATDEELEECNQAKAKAMSKARESGIQIYTIGLNKSGDANIEELQQISDATSGVCHEVKDAADLKDVFAEFYTLIYGAKTIEVMNESVPSNGKISKTFDVPSAGVEEVNIIISSGSTISNLTLEKPDGSKMSADDVKNITTSSKQFSITKITSPVGGTWKLNADGEAGDSIKIDMIFNDCLSLKAQAETKDKFVVGDSIKIDGYLYNNGEKSDVGYEDYTATLFLTKQTTDNKEDAITTEITMDVKDSFYETKVDLDEMGTYTMYLQVAGNGLEKNTKDEPVVVNVGNTAPTVDPDYERMEEHFWLLPFVGNTGEIDLSAAASDAEDGSLTYAVESSSFLSDSYEIDGATLKINNFDLSEGSFTITATDSNGASAQFEVYVTTTNVGLLALIFMVIGAIIVIAILVVLLKVSLGKRFMGTITVTNLETNATDIKQKNRGRIKLSAFMVGNTGFKKNAYFQATGRPHIKFKAGKAVLTADSVTKESTIILDSRIEKIIYCDDTRTRGISVTFNSFAG